MNATELKTIEKLNKPTILPGSVKINVKIEVNEEIPQENELDLTDENEEEIHQTVFIRDSHIKEILCLHLDILDINIVTL